MFKVVYVAKRFKSSVIIRTFNQFSVPIGAVNQTIRSYCDRTKDHIVQTEPLDFNKLKFNSKVPSKPHVSPITEIKIDRIKVDDETIQLLERLSLVNVDSKEAVRTLEDSIEFASKILHIDTTDIEPLYTVLEHQNLYLRPDIVNDGNCRDDILSNAKVREEEYFVAPPGNIPLEQPESKEKRVNNHDDI